MTQAPAFRRAARLIFTRSDRALRAAADLSNSVVLSCPGESKGILRPRPPIFSVHRDFYLTWSVVDPIPQSEAPSRMLAVPIEEVQVGQRLAMDVSHPDHPGQDLLKRGFVLEPAVITKMRELGVPVVYVDYPGLEDLDHHLAIYLSPTRRTLYDQVKSTIAAVQKTAKPTVGFADYYATVRELIVTLMQDGRHPQYVELIGAKMGADAVRHAASVAHLSLALGIKLERYLIDQRDRLPPAHAREVVNLGVAGMLHDLGKAKLPESLQCHCGVDDPLAEPGQQNEWEAHPRIAYEMIRGNVESSAAAAVLHHHQHFDGTGLPAHQNNDGTIRRFGGEQIHVFARILQAVDVYDRLSWDPHTSAHRPTVEVLHLMRTQYSNRLDPQIVNVFPQVVPPFPPGERLKLSDGSTVMVTSVKPEAPYTPVVRRLGPDGWTLTEEVVDLAAPGAPKITATMRELDVRAMIPPPAPTKIAKSAA
jgi:hypothetical protein